MLQYIKARLELFETYWKKFLDTHDVLAGLEGIDETDYVKLDLFSSTEENYLVIKSRLSAKLIKGDTPALHGELSNSNSIIKQIQMPRINLPSRTLGRLVRTLVGGEVRFRFEPLMGILIEYKPGVPKDQGLDGLPSSSSTCSRGSGPETQSTGVSVGT